MLYGVTMTSLKGGCIIVPIFAISNAQEVCYVKNSDGTYRKKYCEFDCCGLSSTYCCSEPGTANTGLIVGLVVGILVLIAVVVGVILYCLYRRRKSRRQGQPVSTNSQEDVKSTVSDDAPYPDKDYPAEPPPDPYYLPPVEMQRLPSLPRQSRSSTHSVPSSPTATTASATVTDI